MLKRAWCSNCRADLPLDCAFFEIRMPPRRLVCAKCDCVMDSPYSFRVTWTGQQLFRIALLTSWAFTNGVILKMTGGIGFATLFFVALGALIPSVIFSSIFCHPVQWILDIAYYSRQVVVAAVPKPQESKVRSSINQRRNPMGKLTAEEERLAATLAEQMKAQFLRQPPRGES